MFHRLCLSLLLLVWGLCADSYGATTTPSEHIRRSEQGVLFYQQGQYREALTEWLAAYSMEPHPNLLLNIGQAYLQLEQPAEATRYYVMFLQTKPHGKDRLRAQAGLDKARDLDAAQRAKQAEPILTPSTELPPQPLQIQPSLPKPIYKKAWFWGIISGVAAAGLVIGLGVGLRPTPTIPDDILN